MFLGSFDTSVDEKGRLSFPTPLKKELKKKVLLRVGKDSCIEIRRAEKKLDKRWLTFEVEVKCVGGNKRITIPSLLRSESNSFWFGRTITLACRGNFIRILPRPG